MDPRHSGRETEHSEGGLVAFKCALFSAVNGDKQLTFTQRTIIGSLGKGLPTNKVLYLAVIEVINICARVATSDIKYFNERKRFTHAIKIRM